MDNNNNKDCKKYTREAKILILPMVLLYICLAVGTWFLGYNSPGGIACLTILSISIIAYIIFIVITFKKCKKKTGY